MYLNTGGIDVVVTGSTSEISRVKRARVLDESDHSSLHQ